MPGLRFIGFAGEVPKVQPRLLPNAGAQRAENVRLEDGGLLPIRRRRLARQFSDAAVGTILSIYRHRGEWLRWSSIVHAAPGPVAQDRLYITGDGAPKMRVDGQTYPLGVPRPSARLSATVVGTPTKDDEDDAPEITTRVYTYTYVTQFGEESAPATVSADVEWQPGQSVVLSGFMRPPKGRAITRQRIYRSQTGASGETTLNFLTERNATDSEFTDTVDQDDFGEVIPSTNWTAPADGLRGLISLPNGMMAAFSGNELHFCEPWYPHAWPQSYILTTDYPIVALGAFGASIVVLTEGMPYLVTGTAPDTMAMERIEQNLPCINARGVVDLGYAVAYPSHDGLVMVSASGAVIATAAVMGSEGWRSINPATIVAGEYRGRYIASYETLTNGQADRGAFIINLAEGAADIVRCNAASSAMFNDREEGSLFFLDGASVYEFDAPGQPFEVYRWRSKQFVAPLQEPSFGVLLVQTVTPKTPAQMRREEADRQAAIARNRALLVDPLGGSLAGTALNVFLVNGDKLEVIPQEVFAEVRLFVDGQHIATKRQLNAITRLPSGYRGQLIEIEITGTAHVAEIRLGTTPDDIAQVT